MSTLLMILLGAAGVSGAVSFHMFRRDEKNREIKAREDEISHQRMLDSPHPPWTPDFFTVGDGTGDDAAFARARAWQENRIRIEADEEAKRRREEDTFFSPFGMGYASANMPTVQDEPETFVGKGGTFDGAGASGDWEPTPNPAMYTPPASYETTTTSYESPTTDSYSTSVDSSSPSSE
jgi:hypothetical protein